MCFGDGASLLRIIFFQIWTPRADGGGGGGGGPHE